MKPVSLVSIVVGALALATLTHNADAKVHSQLVEYKDGDTVLEGYLAVDDAIKSAKKPGILVVHAHWDGARRQRARHRADMLAEARRYIAFAADIYGKGVRPTTRDEAGKLAGKYKGDRALLRQRVNAGYAQLLKSPHVDGAKTAAIGYCFGGTTVLELGRSGTAVNGIVTFHGGLDSPTPADGKNSKAKLLVLHGAADKFEKPEDFAAFQKELTDAKIDWQLTEYGGAVHLASRIRAPGNDPVDGMRLRPGRRCAPSWTAMTAFFAELFGRR